MMVKRIFILLVFGSLFLLIKPNIASAQVGDQALRFGIKVPYSYDIGYYQRFSNRIGMHASTQFITIPFASAPIGYMNLFGADPNITAILAEPFTFGAGLDVGFHYYFGSDNRRYYGALSVQWMNLLKRDIDDEVINNAFDLNFNSPGVVTLGPKSKSQSTKPLTINTNYVNLGFIFGKIVPIPNSIHELRLELAVNKTIFSHHNLQSDYRIFTPISELTNESLQETMRKYGWFPTFNVYYIFKLPN